MKKRDHKKEIEEVRETLTFFHESKNEPTSILVVRIFVHPENHKEYWENCDGFLKMIEEIFNSKIQEEVKNDNIHVHLSTSFSIYSTKTDYNYLITSRLYSVFNFCKRKFKTLLSGPPTLYPHQTPNITLRC